MPLLPYEVVAAREGFFDAFNNDPSISIKIANQMDEVIGAEEGNRTPVY